MRKERENYPLPLQAAIIQKDFYISLCRCFLVLSACGFKPAENSGGSAPGLVVIKPGVGAIYKNLWKPAREALREENINLELVQFSDCVTPDNAPGGFHGRRRWRFPSPQRRSAVFAYEHCAWRQYSTVVRSLYTIYERSLVVEMFFRGGEQRGRSGKQQCLPQTLS